MHWERMWVEALLQVCASQHNPIVLNWPACYHGTLGRQCNEVMRVSEVKILAINKNLIRLSIKGRVRGRMVQYSGKGAACFYTNTHIHTPGLCSAVAGHTSNSPQFPFTSRLLATADPATPIRRGPWGGPINTGSSLFLSALLDKWCHWLAHTLTHIISTRRLDRVGPCGKEALHLGRRPILQTLLEYGEMP